MKRFYIFIITALILNFSIYILGYYFINYPMRFNLWEIIEECGIIFLLIILGVITLVSWLISVIEIRQLSSKTKFLYAFLILNGFLFISLSYFSIDHLIQNKKEIAKLENEYLRQAEKDIKNDQITIEYANGIIVDFNEKIIQQTDSIRKNYGIIYKNTGCFVDLKDIEARQKYNNTVMPYLEKRNGKGWRQRMEKEIENLQKSTNKK
ncbi:FEKKY domain-containing protein [Chryseobacterium populi]|uniref:Uncharacterized protein n=1 Tax=Chryseobacterium populi TaxID=1144316 RepID=J2T843_9FLAO|nr:hypothetical protein [Chryseobacterium populi]EJL74247.1 hypothetical protein PMI13_00980 [Chryseobacterium populi]